MGFVTPSDLIYPNLNDFVSNFLSELQSFQPIARTFSDDIQQANQTYFNDANALFNQKIFWGYGSQAFLTSVIKQISDTDPIVRGLRHVTSQTATYSQAISSDTAYYQNQISTGVEEAFMYGHVGLGSIRDALVNTTLENANLNDILKSGSSALSSPEITAKNSLQSDMVSYVHASYSQFTAAQLAADAQNIQNQITTSQEKVGEVYSQVKVYLDEWADALCKATQDYQGKILNADNYISAGDMFDVIFHPNEPGFNMQNSNKPISIVPFKMADGTTRLVVYISGTDGFHPYYADSIVRAIQNGLYSGDDSQYLKDIDGALLAYLNEHPEFQNPKITLMGYSLGGMAAQELATRLDIPNIDQVITVGSPITDPPLDYSPTSRVDYKIYMGTGDLVPLLSTHETDFSNLTGDRLDRVHQAYTQLTWDEKLHEYIDPNNEYGNSIIPVSDLPFVKDSIFDELKNLLPNHILYSQSNFLENQDISTFDGATQIGNPEYFPVTDFSKK